MRGYCPAGGVRPGQGHSFFFSIGKEERIKEEKANIFVFLHGRKPYLLFFFFFASFNFSQEKEEERTVLSFCPCWTVPIVSCETIAAPWPCGAAIVLTGDPDSQQDLILQVLPLTIRRYTRALYQLDIFRQRIEKKPHILQ